MTLDTDGLMTLAPVIPVLVIEDPADARPVAEALVAGGIYALEVTLRTPAALEVIQEMANVEGAVVGAGTVVSETQLRDAVLAGARFMVSPGLTEPLAKAVIETGLPYLAGVATGSDIMRGLALGLTRFKFFPAEANGGIPALQALAGPFYQCRFCPTGGVNPGNAAAWLELPSVACVGGSWLVPKGPVDRETITANARQAAGLIG